LFREKECLMWYRGQVWSGETGVPSGTVYETMAKVYDMPSMWGICGGRISKLYVGEHGCDPELAALWVYERGWVTEPAPDWVIGEMLREFPS
jgi:hypothetical protein